MGRHTGNQEVVRNLQKALQDFLADQRKSAEKDPKWQEETSKASPKELEDEPGCGCNDCLLAGQLLGDIY
jgi:hypothetical protein